jgi:hypothetical protein
MMNRFLIGISSVALICLIFGGNWSCRKPDTYPEEPHIEYLGFATVGDSAVFRISFTDGDGDIGLSQADTLPPFNSKGKHYKNLKLYYQYLDTISGQYKYYITPKTQTDTVIYAYRIDRINKIGTDKSLNGEIQVFLSAPYYLPTHKTIRFECQLEDRALHVSNKILSPGIITH